MCIVAAGCSATPLQAEPRGAADAAHKDAHPDAQAAPLTTSGVPRDPLDALRERLADKLNVSKTKDAAGADALRVTTQAQAGDHSAASPNGGASSPSHGAPHRAAASLTLAAAARAGALLPRTVPVAAARTAPLALPTQWDYEGSGGPQAWSHLKPEFSTCSAGKRQSPIDIRDGIKVQLDAVQFDYRPSAFSVIDDGHTVQVNVAPGNSIQAMGRRYDLVQFHFHRPSEERVNGRVFDMVVHLVHRDPEGHLAVVAVLLDRGSAHPLVQAVWNNLPLEKGDEVRARLPLDLGALLPSERNYYTYMGSMTTPPCSEGVLWMVMKNPVAISDEQLAIFARLYPMNARPIQAAAGRLIKESN